jgi:hypothetical protein
MVAFNRSIDYDLDIGSLQQVAERGEVVAKLPKRLQD